MEVQKTAPSFEDTAMSPHCGALLDLVCVLACPCSEDRQARLAEVDGAATTLLALMK
jgi:hypothetical protein